MFGIILNIFNSQITKKKHRNAKDAALNALRRTLVDSGTDRKAEGSPHHVGPHVCPLHVEQFKNFTTVCRSANDHKSRMRSDLEITSKF